MKIIPNSDLLVLLPSIILHLNQLDKHPNPLRALLSLLLLLLLLLAYITFPHPFYSKWDAVTDRKKSRHKEQPLPDLLQLHGTRETIPVTLALHLAVDHPVTSWPGVERWHRPNSSTQPKNGVSPFRCLSGNVLN